MLRSNNTFKVIWTEEASNVWCQISKNSFSFFLSICISPNLLYFILSFHLIYLLVNFLFNAVVIKNIESFWNFFFFLLWKVINNIILLNFFFYINVKFDVFSYIIISLSLFIISTTLYYAIRIIWRLSAFGDHEPQNEKDNQFLHQWVYFQIKNNTVIMKINITI